MGELAFLQGEARAKAACAVQAVEAQTSAELVVAVRRRSDSYRGTCWLFALLCACAAMLYAQFSPTVFHPYYLQLDLLLAFGLGYAVCSLTPLRRWLTPGRTKAARVAAAARATFYDLGVSRTSGRNGILLYVSLLERRAELVPDIAIEPRVLGDGWTRAAAAIQAAAGRCDFDALLEAMSALGPALGQAMPRQADDVNELPDEPR